jgi:biotin carboxyl carrier protein
MMNYEVKINGTRRTVKFAPRNEESARPSLTASLMVDGRAVEADAVRISADTFSILIEGRSFEVTVEENPDGLLLRTGGRQFQVEIIDPRSWRRGRGAGVELEGRQQLIAPMPGKIVRVLVAAGDHVDAGQGLLVIEAMKMQNEVRSPKSGTVEKLTVEGRTVSAGEVLAVVV